MNDLPGFLIARLDEAQRLLNDPAVPGNFAVTLADGTRLTVWDKEHFVRELDAKRRILKIHNVWEVVFPADPVLMRDRHCVGCGFNAVEEYETEDINDCPTLQALALSYADHPDYREEWRP